MSPTRFLNLFNLGVLLCTVVVNANCETEIDEALKIETLEAKLEKVLPSNEIVPKNCYDILNQGNTESGVYAIHKTDYADAYTVLCNMDVMGGGWTYVLNRFDGSQDFFLNYTDYKRGFGTLKGEFWLGLEHLYELTGSKYTELLVEIVDQNEKESFAFYESFGIGNETEGYAIKWVDGFSGNAGDSLSIHLNAEFTTPDLDRDGATENCAVTFHGAWWYQDCYTCQLTGAYSTVYSDSGMNWVASSGIALKEARMMIRPQP